MVTEIPSTSLSYATDAHVQAEFLMRNNETIGIAVRLLAEHARHWEASPIKASRNDRQLWGSS